MTEVAFALFPPSAQDGASYVQSLVRPPLGSGAFAGVFLPPVLSDNPYRKRPFVNFIRQNPSTPTLFFLYGLLVVGGLNSRLAVFRAILDFELVLH